MTIKPSQYVPTPLEIERRNRIRLSCAAYAYECLDSPIMADSEFDALALAINPGMSTGRTVLDRFFREEFRPHTGQWIRNHPDLDGVRGILARVHGVGLSPETVRKKKMDSRGGESQPLDRNKYLARVSVDLVRGAPADLIDRLRELPEEDMIDLTLLW